MVENTIPAVTFIFGLVLGALVVSYSTKFWRR